MVATERRVALTRVKSALCCRCQGASPPVGRALGNRRAPPAPDPRLIFARPLHLLPVLPVFDVPKVNCVRMPVPEEGELPAAWRWGDDFRGVDLPGRRIR